jgi:hypothetical protein
VGVVNRRNAVIGWATWTIGKQVVKSKASKAGTRARPARSESRRPWRAGAALAGAAAIGAAVLWRRRSGDDGGELPPP